MATDPKEYVDAKPLRVLIIGAGIAGLAAAIALRKQGHQVTILEKSAFAAEVGAAIHLPPNCTAVLQWMGVNPINFDNTLLQELRLGDEQGQSRTTDYSEVRSQWQAEWYLVHRAHFHSELKRIATDANLNGTPATIHTKCQVVQIDTRKASVILSDGREFSGDILIGADGLHSVTREKVCPGFHPKPAGKKCYRFLIPNQYLLDDPATKEYAETPGVFMEWKGPNSRVACYPCLNNTVMNVGAFVSTGETEPQRAGWNLDAKKEAMICRFSSFGSAPRALLEKADHDLKEYTFFKMDPLPNWSSDVTVLIGDAAHPFQPYMGQGGAMAIEDAASLAIVLPRGVHVRDIPSRLKLFENCRMDRVNTILDFTYRRGRDAHEETGPEITPAEVAQFANMCISHNEVDHSSKALRG